MRLVGNFAKLGGIDDSAADVGMTGSVGRKPAVSSLLIRKFGQYYRLSDEERQVLEGLVARTAVVGKGQDIVCEGDRPSESAVLLTGFAARYNLLRNGKRQITAIHVPGDFVDLHSFLVKQMDHAVQAITPCMVGMVPHETISDMTEKHPRLARLLAVNLALDAAIHRQWIVAMGRRSAREHAAHLLCELFVRLQAVGLTTDNGFELPLTQAEMGDALGLSAVHVNRVLQHLRKEALITWDGDTLVILDWPRLQRMAEFDPTFLRIRPR